MLFPRSPVIRLVIGLFAVLCLIGLSLQYRTTLNLEQMDLEEQRKLEQEQQQARLKQEYQHQQQQQQEYQRQQEQQQLPKHSVEGSKERVPLSTFEVPESLHQTHDVAIPHNIPAWTKEDTVMLGTTIGFNLMAGLLRLEYNKHDDLTGQPQRLDVAELSRAEKTYKALWNYVHPIYQSLPGGDREQERRLYELSQTRPEIEFFLKLEKRLYPWVHHARRTSFSLFKTYSGKGIVFCAGNGQFEFVVTAIQALRSRLKSTLPIQVFHMGDDDLSKERQIYLSKMTTGIELIDVTLVLDNEHMKLGGWAIKPFAMLASRFEEVMFVDADAYFLQDPAVLFDDPGYQATGALFFFDRTLFADTTHQSDWLKSIMPIMSTFPPKSRMFNFLSQHEQESGVVLINKRTRFIGLMSICKMNGKWERDLYSYQYFHGDKETFWTGFEMVQEPYAFMRNYGGAIGELRPDNDQSVCGAQLHLDHKGQPLWWNGGLYRNKNEEDYRYLDFGYWMSGGGHQQHRERFTHDSETMIQVLLDLDLTSSDDLEMEPADPVWDFEKSCLAGGKVERLDQRQKDLANGYVDIDKVAREDGARIFGGDTVDPKTHNWDIV